MSAPDCWRKARSEHFCFDISIFFTYVVCLIAPKVKKTTSTCEKINFNMKCLHYEKIIFQDEIMVKELFTPHNFEKF